MRIRRSEVPTLAERADALGHACALLEPIAPLAALADAVEVLSRVDARTALSAEHTVVGIFGATGSGKSSLVNAVVGQEITRAAVRRPTTASPVAAVIGAGGSDALLDWLEVPDRHQLDGTGSPLEQAVLSAASTRRGQRRRSVTADGRPGMLLLDLPDLDSDHLDNRALAERMTGLVDVIVWVTDPQKYADDVLHRQFVTPLAAHDATTLVVLNQVDRIRPVERAAVLDSLAALVRADGLQGAPVLAASAATGEGIDDLRERLAAIAVRHDAAAARVRTDLETAAEELAASVPVGSLPAEVREADVRVLDEDLAAAARIEPVVTAVGASYRHRAGARLGWPPLRWLRGLRADPLRRLGLQGEQGEGATSRSSLPTPDAATAARASGGVRRFADATSEGGGDAWRSAVRRAARSSEAELPDALDQAVAGADLRGAHRPWWWRAVDVLQWLALAAALVGLGWLTLVAVLGYFQITAPALPRVEIPLWGTEEVALPLPTVLVILGIGAGILLALLGGVLAALGASIERRRVRSLLRERVREVSRRLVVEPVEDVLDVARDAASDLDLASGRRR